MMGEHVSIQERGVGALTQQTLQLSGGNAVDPARTDLPEEWRKLPAFSVLPGGGLSLKETRRGEPDAAPDKLQLGREMWLDVDGGALTVRDRWNGDLNRTWRLDLVQGELGRVDVNGADQLVTSNPEGGAAGVELRPEHARIRQRITRRDQPANDALGGWVGEREDEPAGIGARG